MSEVWKDAVGFEDNYQVSSSGAVRNKNRQTILKCFPNCRGYLMARLSINGKYKTKAVHRMVAETFLGVKSGVPVNHIDGCKTNNCVDNLEKSSTRENTTHYHANGILTGAHYRKDKGRWSSQISINNENIFLGYFDTAQEANERYLQELNKRKLENKYAR